MHGQTLSTNRFAQCVPLSREKRYQALVSMSVSNATCWFEADLKGTLKASKDIVPLNCFL